MGPSSGRAAGLLPSGPDRKPSRRTAVTGLAATAWLATTGTSRAEERRVTRFVDRDDLVEAARPLVARTDLDSVHWPVDLWAPDYCHRDITYVPGAFTLDAGVLERLFEANGFRPRSDSPDVEDDKFHDEDHILFALRGCVMADPAQAGQIRIAVRLIPDRPDMTLPKCVIGVFRRRDRPGLPRGVLVVPGSTVPNVDAVALQYRAAQDAAPGGAPKTLADVPRAANLMPTGRYMYLVGKHGGYGFKGAFRLARRPPPGGEDPAQQAIPVLRPVHRLSPDLHSEWDTWAAFDNIHPAVTPKLKADSWRRGVRFSSEGCITVVEAEAAHRPEAMGRGSNWRRLRAACGLSPADQQDYDAYRSFCLLTGDEAALAAVGPPLRRLRFGSAGEEVKALQGALGLRRDGEFGAATLTAWLARQRDRWPDYRPYHVYSARRGKDVFWT